MDSSRIIGVKQTKSHIGIISSNDDNVNESIGRLLFFQEGQKREGVGVLISSKHIITPISNVVSLTSKQLSQKDSFVFQTSRGEYVGVTELFLEKAFLYDDWTEGQIADQSNCGCAVLQLEKSIENLRPVGLLSMFDFTNYIRSQPTTSNGIFMAGGNNKNIVQIEQSNCSQLKHGLHFFPPPNSVTFRTPEQTPIFVKEATNLDGYCLIGFAKPTSLNDMKQFEIITLSKDNFDSIHRWLNGNNSSFTVEMENTLDSSGRCLKTKELKDVKCEFAHSAKIVSLFKLEKFYVASCSEDKQIKVWNYRTGKLKKIFKTDRACKLVFGLDHYLIGVEGFMLIVIDWKNKRVESISNHTSEIVCLTEIKSSNSSHRQLLVLDAENTLSLYRFEQSTFTKEQDLFRWEPISDTLNACLAYSDSSVILTTAVTGTVILFNWRTCSMEQQFSGKQNESSNGILCSTINPLSRNQLYLSRMNGMLELYDCEKGQLVQRIARFESSSPVISIDKQSSSTIVLSDGKDYCLINCNASSNYFMQRLNSNHSKLVCLVKNLDEEFYMTADVSGRLRIWQLELPACNGISFPFKAPPQFNVLDCPELRDDNQNQHQKYPKAEQENLCETSSFSRENKESSLVDKEADSPEQHPHFNTHINFDQTFSNSKFGEAREQLQQEQFNSKGQIEQVVMENLLSPQFTPSSCSTSPVPSSSQPQTTPQKLKIKQIITPLNLNEVFRVQRSQLEASQHHQQQQFTQLQNPHLLANSFGHQQENMGSDAEDDNSIESEFSLVEKTNIIQQKQASNNIKDENQLVNNFSSFRQNVQISNEVENGQMENIIYEQQAELNRRLQEDLEKVRSNFESLHVDYLQLENKYKCETQKYTKEKESAEEIIAQLDKSAHVINKHSEMIGLLNAELASQKSKVADQQFELTRIKEINQKLEGELYAQKELNVAITNELDKQTSQSLRDHETILQLKREVASFMMLKDQLGALKQMQMQLAQQTTEWNERESNNKEHNLGGAAAEPSNQKNQVKQLQQEQIEEMRKENARAQKVSAQVEAANSNLMQEQSSLKKETDRLKSELRRTKESLEHWVRQYNVLLQREEILTKNLESKEDLISLLRHEIGKITTKPTTATASTMKSATTTTTTTTADQNFFDQNPPSANKQAPVGNDEWNSILSLINNDASFAHLSRIEFLPALNQSPKISQQPFLVSQQQQSSLQPQHQQLTNSEKSLKPDLVNQQNGTFSRSLLPPASHIRQLSNQQLQQQQMNSLIPTLSKESLNIQNEQNQRERRSKSPQSASQNITYSSSHQLLVSQVGRSPTPTDEMNLRNIQRNTSLTSFTSNSAAANSIHDRKSNPQLTPSAGKYSSKLDYNSAAAVTASAIAPTTLNNVASTKLSSMEYTYNSMSPCNRLTPSIAPTVAFLTPTSQQKKQKIEEQLKLHYQSRQQNSASEQQNNRSSMQSLFNSNINRAREEADHQQQIASASQKNNSNLIQPPSASLSPNIKSTTHSYGKQIDLTPTRVSSLQQSQQQLNLSQVQALSQPLHNSQWSQSQSQQQTQSQQSQQKIPGNNNGKFSKDLQLGEVGKEGYYSRSPQSYLGESKSPSSKNTPVTPIGGRSALAKGIAVQVSTIGGNPRHLTHATPVQLSEYQSSKGSNLPYEMASQSSHSQSNFTNANFPLKSQQSLDFSPVVNFRSNHFDYSHSPNINATKISKRPFN